MTIGDILVLLIIIIWFYKNINIFIISIILIKMLSQLIY